MENWLEAFRNANITRAIQSTVRGLLSKKKNQKTTISEVKIQLLNNLISMNADGTPFLNFVEYVYGKNSRFIIFTLNCPKVLI